MSEEFERIIEDGFKDAAQMLRRLKETRAALAAATARAEAAEADAERLADELRTLLKLFDRRLEAYTVGRVYCDRAYVALAAHDAAAEAIEEAL